MALFKCVIPAGSVREATPCTIVALYDQVGELVAVAHFLLEWITPDKDNEQHCYISFPDLAAAVGESSSLTDGDSGDEEVTA
ncbi:hypothetical protein [Desulfovibrio sp. ZJ369]|uniref:hypothetical protein n=1 Tax=Desulfovibrio sp. ZJ369 TaxID=2709793 RepID=UPI00197D2F55|nr:hypothetical protein [Desulfovibrio sp. ZJ369]